MAHGDNALLDETEAEVAEHPTSPSLLHRLKEPRNALISLMAVALVAALAVLGFRMYSANQEDTLRQEALDTARDYSTIMSSFDYQNLDVNKDTIASMSTDEFAGTYRTMVDSLREVVAGGQGQASATATDVGIGSLDDSSAKVLVFVDQQAKNLAAPEGNTQKYRMVVSLVRSGDRWLVSNRRDQVTHHTRRKIHAHSLPGFGKVRVVASHRSDKHHHHGRSVDGGHVSPHTSPTHSISGRSPEPLPTSSCNSVGPRWRTASWRARSNRVLWTAHPWKRARTTTQYLTVAILGDEDERKAYREAVNSVHRHVKSDSNSPVKYNAFNRELQLWVAACLFIGFEDSHQLLHGKMSEEQAESFYKSASTLGTTLQVTEEMWPATRADFERYWNLGCERVVIDERTKQYLIDLVNLQMIAWPIRLVFRNLLRFLTVGFLPPIYRDQLDLEWTEDDRRRFEHLFIFVSFVNRFIPRSVRQAGNTIQMRDIRRRIKASKNLV